MRLSQAKLKNFTFLVSRPQSIQRDEAMYLWFDNGIDKLSILSIPLEDTNRAFYIDKVSRKKIFDRLIKKLSSRKGFNKHLGEYHKLQKRFDLLAKKFCLVKTNRLELKKAYLLFLTAMDEIKDYIVGAFAIEQVLDPLFVALLQERFPKKAQEIYEIVSSQTKLNEHQKMRLAICNLVLHTRVSQKQLDALVKEYGWYGEYTFIEDLLDKKYFQGEIQKLSPKTAFFEKEKLVREIKTNKKMFTRTKREIKDTEILLQADIINEYLFLRTNRTETYKKLQAAARTIYDGIVTLLAKESKKPWTRNEVVKLLNEEVLRYLSGQGLPHFEGVSKRDDVVYYRDHRGAHLIDDENQVKAIKAGLQTTKNNEIIGRVACQGIAHGKAALVFSKADLDKVEPGMILVARTTMPDYIVAMTKAAAFVTDEGGVTSHAAIVARELKKPCIVGTKAATKLIKDGDMLEVDAYEGKVTIAVSEAKEFPNRWEEISHYTHATL